MAVDGISGSVVYSSFQLSISMQSTQTTISAVDKDGDNDSGKVGGPKGGGGQMRAFMDSVMQTLDQLGFGPQGRGPNAPKAATSTAPTDNDSNNDSGKPGTDNVKQALNAFLHSMFKALKQDTTGNQVSGNSNSDNTNNSGNSGKAAAAAHLLSDGYGNMTSKLQNLLKSLNPDSSGTNTNTADLNSTFQNLIDSLTKEKAPDSPTGNQPNLQTFLQTLIQNLASRSNQTPGAVNSVGNIVSTEA
ncbi:MAG: hypothetical protein H7844_03455 [Nitrospirae bacterium YQR-1]